MAKHNGKGAVYGITAALVFAAFAFPVTASPLLVNIGESQSAAVSDLTFGQGYDLEAMIITTVEQDQRSPYANKGICIADEFTGIMTKPDESSELVGKLYKDAGCEIISTENGWTKIKSGSCEGYVANQQLITGVEAEEYAQKNGVTELVVKAQGDGAKITLYAEPSDTAKVVATIDDVQSVSVVDAAEDGWTQVTIGSNQGYLYNASVVFDIKYDTAVPEEAEEEAAETEAPAEQPETEAEAAAESTEPEVEAETEAPAETEAETVEETDAVKAEEVSISDVDETVWATTAVYIRKDYSTNSDILGILGEGYSIARTGIVSNGWSRVSFDGETAFIKSEFLTTEQPAASADAEINETVYTTTDVNIRAEASTSSEILGLAEAGSKFTRTMVSGAWSKISYNGQDAYIKSEFLTTEAPAAETQPAEEPKEEETTSSAGVTEWYDTVYATTAVNVRSGAGTGYSRLGMLYAGESVERTGKTDNGWSRVNYNGQEAYINSDYLTTEEPVQESSDDETVSVGSSSETSSLGQEIANFALQYVGYPYVYGGNSLTNGVDCSGFAQQVYLHFGYSITRTAQAQAGDGTPVSLDSLQPGDLVFYADDDGSIGHVTIYIGGGQVVHASNPYYGIIVSEINYRTPVWAVRII